MRRLVLAGAMTEGPVPSRQQLVELVSTLGLAGAPFLLEGREHFTAGERFLEHVMFLGCAPSIQLELPPEPGDGTGFCHLHVQESSEVAMLYVGPGVTPRCPACRSPLLDPGRDPARELTCDCGARSAVGALDWRHGAAAGRCFVEIWGVYPHEAVPGEALLADLAQLTGGRDWSWCYLAG